MGVGTAAADALGEGEAEVVAVGIKLGLALTVGGITVGEGVVDTEGITEGDCPGLAAQEKENRVSANRRRARIGFL